MTCWCKPDCRHVLVHIQSTRQSVRIGKRREPPRQLHQRRGNSVRKHRLRWQQSIPSSKEKLIGMRE